MTIKTLLVPTDFSENARRAFEQAYSLACQLGAKLYVLHVQDESNLRTAIKEGLFDPGSTDEGLREAVEQLTEQRFSEMLAGIDQTQIEIEHLSRRGDSRIAIIDFAVEVSADLIVIGMRGAGVIEKLKSALMGSIAECVLRRAPCPVLVVRLDHKSADG